jgi:nicotinamide mononucleotide transporter
MDWTEVLGFGTGAACVWLAARENIWSWPVGIANNIFYFVVFWGAGLYADSLLQLFYLGISIYGWVKWARGGPAHRTLPASRTSRAMAVGLVAFGVIAAATMYLVLRHYTDSTVPAGDAITTAMSLTAQFMLGRKLVENWLVWIVVDVIYIGLYSYKALYLTAVLYAIFIVMCVVGYRRWRAGMTAASQPALVEH